MRFASRWSIGHRLGAGLGLVVLVIAAFAVTVGVLQARSAEAQAQFTERHEPRRRAAVAVERSILHLAVAIRAYLIAPRPEETASVERNQQRVRDALAALAAIPMDPDGALAFADARPAVERYVTVVGESLGTGVLENRAALEGALAIARETAVALVRRFADVQDDKARRALEAMQASRERVDLAMQVSFPLLAALLLMFGASIMRSIRTPARALTRVAGELQEGNWQPALAWSPTAIRERRGDLHPRDELARIALAFGAAAESLERREHRLRADARVAAAASASLDKAALAEQALRAMVDGAGACVGAIYWRGPGDGALLPIAAHALREAPDPLEVGEGLPGEAAREGRIRVLADIPPDTALRVRLGVEEAIPRAVVAVPAVLRGEVMGVAVLGSLRAFDDAALDFLQSAGLQLAIGLQNVRAHDEAQRLLAELRVAHERVQSQNEELQAQGEELQAQNEEIQAQNEEIQAQSEELQAQNEELHRHADALLQADDRKNHFLGVLSHELRNPLAAIANSLFLLDRGDHADARAVQVIQRQMRYLTRLIDDLLDVTRISRDKLRLQREPLDLVALAREVAGDSGDAVERAGLTLVTELPPAPVHVDGDRTRLAQILGNLLSNAAKFTPRGGTIRLSLEAAGGKVAIHVADTGPGVEARVAPLLFQAFSQGDPGFARTNGGLGLGLAVARALAELHDGTLTLANPGSAGADFVLTLPTCAQAPESARPRPERAAPARTARRILLVEDNEDAAETLRMALALDGHKVEVANSGTEAVEKALAFIPEIVLCDLGIPGFDGFEVARRLRAEPALAATTLVALSGYATREDRTRSAAAGFDHHLAKPAPLDALFELISAVRPVTTTT